MEWVQYSGFNTEKSCINKEHTIIKNRLSFQPLRALLMFLVVNNEQQFDEAITPSSANSEQPCFQEALSSTKTATLREANSPPRRSKRDRRSKQEKRMENDANYKKKLEDKDESALEIVEIGGKGKGVLVSQEKLLHSTLVIIFLDSESLTPW
jgi:hypothetical protein